MLPLVLDEEQIFVFNFWFNESVHCGMHHEGDLYCRLASFPLQKRPQVYQLGCKLARQHTAIVLSSSASACSLWGSLRDPSLKRILVTLNKTNLLDAMLSLGTNVLLSNNQATSDSFVQAPSDREQG